MGIVPRLTAGMWAIALSACATHQQIPLSSTEGTTIVRSGVVTNIRDVTTRNERTTGVGSIVGGVVGGILGSNVGGGTGSTLSGIGGALAGGVTGNQIEKSAHGSVSTTVLSVRFDNGDVSTYNVDSGEPFRIGERVTVTARNGIAQVTHQ